MKKESFLRTGAAFGIAATGGVGHAIEKNISAERLNPNPIVQQNSESLRSIEDYLAGGELEVGEYNFAHPAMHETWERTDGVVASGDVSRTWMWGPGPISEPMYEKYSDAPGGERLVQYFDKSRMEITDLEGDRDSLWYVTNGLLVNEMVSGQMQVGDYETKFLGPAEVNVAGDLDDPNGPTYASFFNLREGVVKKIDDDEDTPENEGTPILQKVDRAGNVTHEPNLYEEDAVIGHYEAGHNIASPFWNFMNSEGMIINKEGEKETGKIFENPYYATGFPITEPYWADVKVGGVEKKVLIQLFERRALTYTPDNPEGWKVEAGNVGLQYKEWREQHGELCVVDELPFKKEDPELSTSNFQIVNEGCIGGFVNGGDVNQDFSELSEAISKIDSRVKIKTIIHESPEDVSNQEEARFVPWGANIPGAPTGLQYTQYNSETGEMVYELSIPSKWLKDNLGEDDDGWNLINVITIASILTAVDTKGDVSDAWDDPTREAYRKLAKDEHTSGNHNYPIRFVVK